MSTLADRFWFQAMMGGLHQPSPRRLRVEHRGQTVAETDRALLVWEPRRVVPSYAVPLEDVKAGLAPAPTLADQPDPAGFPVLHPGIPFAVHTLEGESLTVSTGADQRLNAAFRPADPDLAGYLVLDFTAFDAWYEEDDQIFGHPQSPYSRISVRHSSRPVRVEVDGEVVAESRESKLLFETGLPTRYYLPRADVSTDLLTPSDTHTWCAYKGQASYYSVRPGATTHDDLVWYYPEPLFDATPVQDMLCFWNEKVDLFIDGVRQERPTWDFD